MDKKKVLKTFNEDVFPSKWISSFNQLKVSEQNDCYNSTNDAYSKIDTSKFKLCDKLGLVKNYEATVGKLQKATQTNTFQKAIDEIQTNEHERLSALARVIPVDSVLPLGFRNENENTLTSKLGITLKKDDYKRLLQLFQTLDIPLSRSIYEQADKDMVEDERLFELLQDHQQTIVREMSTRLRASVVCHSPGSGKTITSLALATTWLESNPDHRVVIITVPSANFTLEFAKMLAAMDNSSDIPAYQDAVTKWMKDHIQRFQVATIHEFINGKARSNIKPFDKSKCDQNLLLIVDEMHKFIMTEQNSKEFKSFSSDFLHILYCAATAGKVLLMTGTPFRDRPTELYSYLALLQTLVHLGHSTHETRDKRAKNIYDIYVDELEYILDLSQSENTNVIANYIKENQLSCMFSFFEPTSVADKYPGFTETFVFSKMSQEFEDAYIKLLPTTTITEKKGEKRKPLDDTKQDEQASVVTKKVKQQIVTPWFVRWVIGEPSEFLSQVQPASQQQQPVLLDKLIDKMTSTEKDSFYNKQRQLNIHPQIRSIKSLHETSKTITEENIVDTILDQGVKYMNPSFETLLAMLLHIEQEQTSGKVLIYHERLGFGTYFIFKFLQQQFRALNCEHKFDIVDLSNVDPSTPSVKAIINHPQKELGYESFLHQKMNRSSQVQPPPIRIFIISNKFAQGVDFKNLSHIFIMTSSFNEIDIIQVKGRGIRLESHQRLPEPFRQVQIYRLLSVTSDEFQALNDIFSTYNIGSRRCVTTNTKNTREKLQIVPETSTCSNMLSVQVVDHPYTFVHDQLNMILRPDIHDKMIADILKEALQKVKTNVSFDLLVLVNFSLAKIKEVEDLILYLKHHSLETCAANNPNPTRLTLVEQSHFLPTVETEFKLEDDIIHFEQDEKAEMETIIEHFLFSRFKPANQTYLDLGVQYDILPFERSTYEQGKQIATVKGQRHFFVQKLLHAFSLEPNTTMSLDVLKDDIDTFMYDIQQAYFQEHRIHDTECTSMKEDSQIVDYLFCMTMRWYKLLWPMIQQELVNETSPDTSMMLPTNEAEDYAQSLLQKLMESNAQHTLETDKSSLYSFVNYIKETILDVIMLQDERDKAQITLHDVKEQFEHTKTSLLTDDAQEPDEQEHNEEQVRVLDSIETVLKHAQSAFENASNMLYFDVSCVVIKELFNLKTKNKTLYESYKQYFQREFSPQYNSIYKQVEKYMTHADFEQALANIYILDRFNTWFLQNIASSTSSTSLSVTPSTAFLFVASKDEFGRTVYEPVVSSGIFKLTSKEQHDIIQLYKLLKQIKVKPGDDKLHGFLRLVLQPNVELFVKDENNQMLVRQPQYAHDRSSFVLKYHLPNATQTSINTLPTISNPVDKVNLASADGIELGDYIDHFSLDTQIERIIEWVDEHLDLDADDEITVQYIQEQFPLLVRVKQAKQMKTKLPANETINQRIEQVQTRLRITPFLQPTIEQQMKQVIREEVENPSILDQVYEYISTQFDLLQSFVDTLQSEFEHEPWVLTQYLLITFLHFATQMFEQYQQVHTFITGELHDMIKARLLPPVVVQIEEQVTIAPVKRKFARV